MTTIQAASRNDLAALVKVREVLERGESCLVEFALVEEGKPSFAVFTPSNLAAVYSKITYSM